MTAAQFAQATFVAGGGGTADSLAVQAFDGKAYSGWNTPVRSGLGSQSRPDGQPGQWRQLHRSAPAQSISVSCSVQRQRQRRRCAHPLISMTPIPRPTAATSWWAAMSLRRKPLTQLTATQFAQASFVTGAGGTSDNISVQTYDGKAYSGWNTSVQVARACRSQPRADRCHALGRQPVRHRVADAPGLQPVPRQ